jgi:PatG C-terminal
LVDEHIFGSRPKDGDKLKLYDDQALRLSNFLSRVYFDLRNLGMAAEQRALNYSATNAVQVASVIRSVAANKLDLDRVAVTKSPVCRPDSDCYDVELSFFDPSNIYAANQIFRFTVDVSDVVPVTIGSVRSWWRRA